MGRRSFLLFIGVSITVSASSLTALSATTLSDLGNAIPLRVLQRSVSARFYRSLLISPIQDRVSVEARLTGTHLAGARIVRSSANKAYNDLALKLANEVTLAGNRSIGNLTAAETATVHLLVYRIADGTMALSFAHLDGPGGSQMKYFGSARLLVSKNDGRWDEIKPPESLRDKGWAVRESGGRNNLKLDRIPQHFSLMAPP
jgi:hypothetical protein